MRGIRDWFSSLSTGAKLAVFAGLILFVFVASPLIAGIGAIFIILSPLAAILVYFSKPVREKVANMKIPGIGKAARPLSVAIIIFAYLFVSGIALAGIGTAVSQGVYGPTEEASVEKVAGKKEVDTEKTEIEKKEEVTEEPEETTEKATTEEETEEEPKDIYAKVTRVIDGDTIEIRFDDGKTARVRYIGIDTPERGDPYYEEAAEKNKELVLNKNVKLVKDVSETDKYGRLLRYVYVGDLFVNAELVKQGYAQASTYPPDVEYAELFKDLQRQARESEIGLWAPVASGGTSEEETSEPEKPKTDGGGAVTVYITNTGEKYHRGTCRYLSQSKIEISLSDARARGYEPCKVCDPPQ